MRLILFISFLIFTIFDASLAAQDTRPTNSSNPTIMVIPETPKGQTPIQVLDENPLAKQAATVIESYLTQRHYDVTLPKAIDQLNNFTDIQCQAKGQEQDNNYHLALSLGSDVYTIFSGQVQAGMASVQVKAYETTTGRLLGAEVGYSTTGTNEDQLVEDAVKIAIDKVLQKVNNYWDDDMLNGMQYKLIFKLTGKFSRDKAQKLQDAVSDIIDKEFRINKENSVTDKTIDYQIWAKKESYDKSSKIERMFRTKLVNLCKVDKIFINRKLLILGLGNN